MPRGFTGIAWTLVVTSVACGRTDFESLNPATPPRLFPQDTGVRPPPVPPDATVRIDAGTPPDIGLPVLPPDAGRPSLDAQVVIDAGSPSADWTNTGRVVRRGACEGEFYVRYHARFDRWVGAIVCAPDRYKLMMSLEADETFHQIADQDGQGQDHCELVNPDFQLFDERNINSGACEDCRLGPIRRLPLNQPVWARRRFGQEFGFLPTGDLNLRTYAWIECGVRIP